MKSRSNGFNPSAAVEVQSFQAILDGLQHIENRTAMLRAGFQRFLSVCEFIGGRLNSQEIVLMLRNKWGFTKKEAQKLFYDMKKGGDKSDHGSDNDSKQPESTEEKISMIMDYMRETSAKLDSIDQDIAHLKRQVAEILKRI
ncbi:MAG: hypothetical protein JXR73_18905 [Candidatus Omnitrophica bacterium]|nr:hypothetical protein [Candidatus Omnitrophota bacterium]